MRTLTLAALLLVVLSACGTESGDTAADPGGQPPMPTTIPAAPGEVSTRGIVTILDDGEGPELCLGAVAESWPPQCGGPPVLGWDWKQQRMVPGQAGGAGGRGAF